MKTLLSLIGVISAINSSVIPIELINNDHNVIQHETSRKTLTKDFSYRVDTHYDKVEQSIHEHTEFSKFVTNLKEFTKSREVIGWKLKSYTTKIGPLDPAVENENTEELNTFLHYDLDLKYFIEINGPDQQNKWILQQKVSALLDNGHEFKSSNFNAYGTNRSFTADEIKRGLTQTFTIVYEASDQINIADESYKTEADFQMKFYVQPLDDFKNYLVPLITSNYLKKTGYNNVKKEWISFKKMFWLDKDEEVDDELIRGMKYGAGEYRFNVTVEASELGKQNNIVGELTYILTLFYPYGDLNTKQNSEINGWYEPMPKTLDEFKIAVMKKTSLWLVVPINALQVADYDIYHKFAIDIGEIYDQETHKVITKEEFENWKSGPKKIYYFVTATEFGKQMGIQNTAKIFLNFDF